MAKIPTRPCKWGPELDKGPDWQCCRAQRRLYSTGLPACPRSRGYSRPNGGGREIFAGVRKIAPIGARMGRSKAHCGGRISCTPILCQRPRCSYAVLTGGRCANGTGSSKHYGSWHIDQRLGAGSCQTFCNGPHWDYHPINGDRGLDASKLHPKSKRRGRCPSKDARGSPPNGVHPYVAALQRDASVSPGDAIESIGGRNRGGVQQPCCFEQYTCSIHRLLRLSGIIWGWSDQTTFVHPPIGTCASSTTTAYFGSRGTGSWPGTTIGCCCYHYDWAGDYVSPRQCLGDRTAEVYGLAFATATGGGAFTLSGPGVSSAGGGIVFERTNRAVFVAHIAPERANEVVYNPWIGCTGVVREAYQFVASQDSRTSAIIPRPANRGTSLRFRHDKYPMLYGGLWRMFKPMVGWWKIRNPELDWFLGGPRFELWNLKDKTPKRLRPNRGGTSLFLPRQKNWWCHMDSGMSGSTWLVSGSTWLVSGSTWLVSGSTWLVSGSAWLVSGSAWLVSGSEWSVTGSAWSVTGSAWSVTGSRSCGSGRLCSAWSELCVFCLAECRMACMFCWLSMKLQFCMSGSSHCDELPRSVLRKLSSLEPGRELFGVAVWILEDLSGQCWMLTCSVFRLLRKMRRSPRRRRKSRLLPRFRTLRVRCMRHVVNDDTRRGVIKRSELRAWTELNQRRAENSDYLRFARGAVNHVLAGLPSGAPEGAEPVGESEVEKPVDPAADVGPIDLDPEELAIPLTSQALRDHVCRGHQPYLSNCASCVCARGRIPARRVKLPQKEYKVIGLDFLFFGKLRVLLLVHTASRYTFAFPVQDPESVEQDVALTFGKFVREIGLQNGVVTLRCDNEAFLIKVCGILAKKPQPCERILVEQVPGYRPQAKGNVERQVAVVKQAFWSNWLEVEAKLSISSQIEKLPLGR